MAQSHGGVANRHVQRGPGGTIPEKSGLPVGARRVQPVPPVRRSEAQITLELGYVLLHLGREIALRKHKSYVIGRQPSCEIVLDDRMVSRLHARLTVRDTVTLEDLGSANGVFVDGVRIQHPIVLEERTRIQIGSKELVLSRVEIEQRSRLDTTRGRPSHPTLPEVPQSRLIEGDATDRRGYDEVLGKLADSLIARGHGAEAESLVGGHMLNVLEQWRRTGQGDLVLAESCAARALALARVTSKSFWLEYVFELYASIDALLPEPLIDESYRVVHQVRRPSSDALGTYVERVASHELKPAERFRVRRLEGLKRMICAL